MDDGLWMKSLVRRALKLSFVKVSLICFDKCNCNVTAIEQLQ